MVLVVCLYDSVSLLFEGDGKGGFRIETVKGRINSENIGKEYKCTLAEKEAKGADTDHHFEMVRVIPVER